MRLLQIGKYRREATRFLPGGVFPLNKEHVASPSSACRLVMTSTVLDVNCPLRYYKLYETILRSDHSVHFCKNF
jgi:hypothetical protein